MSLFYSIPDVYDMAADIGREFESLIDSHGAEHVTALMQKVGNQLTNRLGLSLDRGEYTCNQPEIIREKVLNKYIFASQQSVSLGTNS